MVKIAREKSQQIGVDIKYYIDSCSELNCFDDAIFDLLISNPGLTILIIKSDRNDLILDKILKLH